MPRSGLIKTEIIVAVAVLLLSNAAIFAFINLAEKRQEDGGV
jgi:hypothetical protein